MAETFRHPDKWRETCDVFALPYHSFRPTEILGYPHAGNDVFHVRGLCQGRQVTAYVKAPRRNGGAGIRNEALVLSRLALPLAPEVLDAGTGDAPFLVTAEKPGRRLSVIVGDNAGGAALSYMEEYGGTLARLHMLRPEVPPVADRRFFHPPTAEHLEALGLVHLASWFAHPPDGGTTVFCHGDFHYANLLWEDHHISGILDFELAGYGDRDFDIAWALILRPGQTFLKTAEERRRFLMGYGRHGSFDAAAIRFYMAQIYTYFLQFSGDDPAYQAYVRGWLEENCAETKQLGDTL